VKHSPSAETLGSVFEHLFQTSQILPADISWPPDAFCFAALALQKSSAYTFLVGGERPVLKFKHTKKERVEALESVGEQWRDAAAENRRAPAVVIKWLSLIKENSGLALQDLKKRKTVLAALLNLMAAADEG
jgi:DNA gyrase inhibitor GyrI